MAAGRRPLPRPAIRRPVARRPAAVRLRQRVAEDRPLRAVVRLRPAGQPQLAAVAEQPRVRALGLPRGPSVSPRSPERRSPRGPRRRVRSSVAWSGAAPKATPARRKRARRRRRQASNGPTSSNPPLRPSPPRPRSRQRHRGRAELVRRRPRRTRSRGSDPNRGARRRRRRRSRSSRRHRRDTPHHHQRRRPRRIRASGNRPHRTRREEVNRPPQERRRTDGSVSCSDLTEPRSVAASARPRMVPSAYLADDHPHASPEGAPWPPPSTS